MPGLDDNNEPVVPAGGTPPAPPATPPTPPVRVVGNGGEIPEERVSEIRRESAQRERRRLLKEMWGTDDEDEVKKLQAAQKEALGEATKLKEDREKARLAELTETERLKAELLAANSKYDADTARLTRERDSHKAELETERQDVLITGFASKHIAGKFLKTAKVEFGEYVAGLNKTETAALDQKKIDAWFAKYAKDNPEFAPPKAVVAKTAEQLAAEEKAKAAAAIPPKRVPVGAAPRGGTARPPVPAARPVNGPNTFKGKLVKNLSKAELTEYWASKGMKRPY